MRPKTTAPKNAPRMAEPVTQLVCERAEVPLGRDEGGHRADDEQVVGIGEEADPGDDHRAAVEPARGCLVRGGH